jgi:hypothetical protein
MTDIDSKIAEENRKIKKLEVDIKSDTNMPDEDEEQEEEDMPETNLQPEKIKIKVKEEDHLDIGILHVELKEDLDAIVDLTDTF